MNTDNQRLWYKYFHIFWNFTNNSLKKMLPGAVICNEKTSKTHHWLLCISYSFDTGRKNSCNQHQSKQSNCTFLDPSGWSLTSFFRVCIFLTGKVPIIFEEKNIFTLTVKKINILAYNLLKNVQPFQIFFLHFCITRNKQFGLGFFLLRILWNIYWIN